jgi:hypothetical protein
MQNFNSATSPTVSTIAHLPGHNEILKPVDAAGYLQLSPSTLAKMRLYGTGPRYTKAGRAVRYRRSDLDLWIDAAFRRLLLLGSYGSGWEVKIGLSDSQCTRPAHKHPCAQPI